MSVSKVALIVLVSLPAVAIGQPSTVVPAAPVAAQQKIVCRNEVPVGSIRFKRVCRTKEQWTTFHDRNREAAERGIESVRDRANAGINAQ
jgi:hypothetical protein